MLFFVILIPGIILEVVAVSGLINMSKWYNRCTALVKADIVGEVRWTEAGPELYDTIPEMYVPNRKRSPLVEYHIGNKERIRSYDKRITISSTHPYIIGESIQIKYNPKEPKAFVDPSLKSGATAKLAGLALLVFAVEFFVLLILML